jgi:hypothetical protein
MGEGRGSRCCSRSRRSSSVCRRRPSWPRPRRRGHRWSRRPVRSPSPTEGRCSRSLTRTGSAIPSRLRFPISTRVTPEPLSGAQSLPMQGGLNLCEVGPDQAAYLARVFPQQVNEREPDGAWTDVRGDLDPTRQLLERQESRRRHPVLHRCLERTPRTVRVNQGGR